MFQDGAQPQPTCTIIIQNGFHEIWPLEILEPKQTTVMVPGGRNPAGPLTILHFPVDAMTAVFLGI